MAELGYAGAGTVEFLYENGEFYFIEMNTRLQVEHPVTEAITGLDLVEWQLRVASGERLPHTQTQIEMSGHAVEARLNAEDPERGFLPSTGPIVAFDVPPAEGLRVDTGVEKGSEISPFYDSMIAKLITHAPDRAQALASLSTALETMAVAGPKTNAAFLHALATHPDFQGGAFDTGFIARELAQLTRGATDPRAVAFGVTHLLWQAHDQVEATRQDISGEGYSPWSTQDAFQIGAARTQALTVLVDGTPTKVDVAWGGAAPKVTVAGQSPGEAGGAPNLRIAGEGNPLYVLSDMRQIELRWPTYDASAVEQENGNTVRAPIIGRVAKIFVRKGDSVAKGDRVAVVEAMKMEHVLHAPRDGRIEKVDVKEGQQVIEGALIAALAET
jgi:3-methylcrotonyl-CoA carboxylase alpha subunit